MWAPESCLYVSWRKIVIFIVFRILIIFIEMETTIKWEYDCNGLKLNLKDILTNNYTNQYTLY